MVCGDLLIGSQVACMAFIQFVYWRANLATRKGNRASADEPFPFDRVHVLAEE
jgi:hypothetical protein